MKITGQSMIMQESIKTRRESRITQASVGTRRAFNDHALNTNNLQGSGSRRTGKRKLGFYTKFKKIKNIVEIIEDYREKEKIRDHERF